MASVFKRGGKKNRNGYYYAAWHDANGKRHVQCAKTTDKDAALQFAHKKETEGMLRRRGIINHAADRYSIQARKPVVEHLAEFKAHLEAKQNTELHCYETYTQASRICEVGKIQYVNELTASAVQAAIKAIRDAGDSRKKKDREPLSLKTCNHYLRAIKSFSRWLGPLGDKRCQEDALAALQAFNADTDPRHVRREASPDELLRLILSTEKRTRIEHKINGPDRAMAYRLALGTGFRAKELRSLTPESFALASSPPTVTVTAAHSKHRREDVQPIRPDLATLIAAWLKDKPARKVVFPTLPKNTARMLRSDLKAARAAWIDEAASENEKAQRQESDFLKPENVAGEVFDFHATRHTYISGIVNGGASVKVAQELARHSTPTLTIGRYAHARRDDLKGALDSRRMGPEST